MEFKTCQKLTTFRITNIAMYVFLLCLLQLVGATPSRHGQRDVQGQVDNNCRGHKKFTKCNCDEFGVVLNREEKTAYEEAGINVHQRVDLALNSKRPYYYCEVCKKCGDNLLVEYECTQKSDTVCSDDKCADETWIFNFVMKACQPPPPPPTTTPSSTVVDKVTRQDEESVAAGRVTGSEVIGDEPNLGSSLWLQKNSRVIILALIGGVVVFFAVIMIMAVLVIRMRRQVDGLLAPGTPSSSHNSSTVSVAAVHV